MEAEVGGGGRGEICGVVEVVVVVVQASGFACGVPVFISLFQFIFFQCLNSRLNDLHMLCFSNLIESCCCPLCCCLIV